VAEALATTTATIIVAKAPLRRSENADPLIILKLRTINKRKDTPWLLYLRLAECQDQRHLRYHAL
jgi:hypothetical protein